MMKRNEAMMHPLYIINSKAPAYYSTDRVSPSPDSLCGPKMTLFFIADYLVHYEYNKWFTSCQWWNDEYLKIVKLS